MKRSMGLVLSVAQSRAVDRAAMNLLGIPGLVLMENAGRRAAEVVHALASNGVSGGLPGRRIIVLCGAGQNGGDGFVVARHLAGHGAEVEIHLVLPATKIAGDAALNLAVARNMRTMVLRDGSSDARQSKWRERLRGADVIVDAIFGTGLRADARGVPAAAIAACNATRGATKVALDVPSGMDADTGAVRGIALQADVTVSMGARKLGPSLDAEAPVGEVEVADLGVSLTTPILLAAARAEGPLCHWLTDDAVRAVLPRRKPGHHKGNGGHVCLVAGSAGKTGAAVLAARAVLRGGAGLVTIASTSAGQKALDAKVVEAMTASYSDGKDAGEDAYGRVASLAERMKVVAVGPGIPTGPGAAVLCARLAALLPLPVVLDADALNLLGRDAAGVLRRARAARIVTPHPGELARLVGRSIAAVQRDRLGHARRLAAASGAVVVLKGARTIIAGPDGESFINPAANPSLGTAGSGDVLLGIIAAFCAQGLSAIDAACAGVFFHASAADEATRKLGSRRLVAGDLPEAIARVIDPVYTAAS